MKPHSQSLYIVPLSGRIDVSTVDMLQEVLLAALKRPEPKIIADLTQVDSVSSAGLRMFVRVAEAFVKAKRKLVFVSPRASLTQSFTSSGFGMLFDFYADLDLAKASLNPPL